MSGIILVGGEPNPTTFGVQRTESVIDQTFGSLRVALKPSEYNLGGAMQGSHNRIGRAVAGLTGVAGAGPVVSLRWSSVQLSELMIKAVRVGALISTVFTTAQPIDFDLIIARNFTVADTGGTAVTPIPSANQKMRSKWMNPQIVSLADLRETSGAALTAGTRTLDASPIAQAAVNQNASNALGAGGIVDLYKHDKMAGHPLMLQSNEGIVIRVGTAMGAAGVLRFFYEIEFAEVPGI